MKRACHKRITQGGDYKLNWTPDELKVYMFLFFNCIDYVNPDLNKRYVNNLEFNNIHQEFNGDNDYQSIQKICAAVETKNYSKTQLFAFLEDIKKWFAWTEKEQSCLQSNKFNALERILKKAA